MIRFVSISAFRATLDALLKVKHGIYTGVTTEICKAFQNISIEQIRANRDMILTELLNAFSQESAKQQIVIHDIYNNLKEI